MKRPIVQIYEIQTPGEAAEMVALGVDHVGSVITSTEKRRDPVIRDTIARVKAEGAVSSLIPLYTDTDAVLETLAYQRPQIIHFCDQLDPDGNDSLEAALALQQAVKAAFPEVRIMRSIPIGERGHADGRQVLALARQLEASSDFFLTDTVLGDPAGPADADQPVSGFVGITGLTCDWDVAAQLVEQSPIPVVLAGGISPENVAAGILRVQPFGVDSCTCTNAVDSDGRPVRFRKDINRVRQLLIATKQAAGNPR